MLFILIGLCFLTGCSAPAPRPLFTYYNPQISKAETDSLLARVALLEKKKEFKTKGIYLETLAQNPLASHHLVLIRDQEPLHYHAYHDGWAVVIKGEAGFLLGDSTMALRPGASVYIPRSVRHRAVRKGPETLAAFVIFTPPYDGKDMIRVKEK